MEMLTQNLQIHGASETREIQVECKFPLLELWARNDNTKWEAKYIKRRKKQQQQEKMVLQFSEKIGTTLTLESFRF